MCLSSLVYIYSSPPMAMQCSGNEVLLFIFFSSNDPLKKKTKRVSCFCVAVDRDKETAVHCAVEEGHADVLKVLIQNGADVPTGEQDEWTLLHRAAARLDEHLDVVNVLIAGIPYPDDL